MRELLEETLLLQTEWTSKNTPTMARRGVLIRHELAAWLRDRLPGIVATLPAEVQDLAVEGRDGTGLKTEIPWVRIYSPSRSPSATEGWYVVYLFSARGDRVYLTIEQATTRWENGEFRPRPVAELAAQVAWARIQLAADLSARPDTSGDIDLDATTRLGRSYAAGIVTALAYDIDSIPNESQLELDMQYMVEVLGKLYMKVDTSLDLPGELPPEISDALRLADRASGRRAKGQGYRLTTEEKLAVEKRAVAVAFHHLEVGGWTVTDVGDTASFDLDARKPGQRLYVEVKGTTSLGEEVVLTHNEVQLHTENQPDTMLAIVHGINLDRSVSPPIASAGTLRTISPWAPDPAALTPIAYRYRVPVGGVAPNIPSELGDPPVKIIGAPAVLATATLT